MSHIEQISEEQIASYRETLKRCPEGTTEALVRFLTYRDKSDLSVFFVGVIKRHTEEEYHELLEGSLEGISFIDDLGIDSMTMMEVVMMVEECLGIRLNNEHLANIRTYGDLDSYISDKLDLSS